MTLDEALQAGLPVATDEVGVVVLTEDVANAMDAAVEALRRELKPIVYGHWWVCEDAEEEW